MAERSALSRSSLYAGIFVDEAKDNSSVTQPKDSNKDPASDTVLEQTPARALPPTSIDKPTAPWSTALRFAPRAKQKSGLHDKGNARVSRVLSQASADQAFHHDGGISAAVNDGKECDSKGVEHIAAPPMDVPQDQIEKDKTRAWRERELFRYEDEQHDEMNPAVHTRKSSSRYESLMDLVMSDYDPMYPNDYTQYTSLLKKHHETVAHSKTLDHQDDPTERDNDYAFRFRKFAPPAFYSQSKTVSSSFREPEQQDKIPSPPRPPMPPGPPPPIPSHLIKADGPQKTLGPPPGPAPLRPLFLAACGSEPMPDSSDASIQPDASAATAGTPSPVRNTFPQESGAHNFAERLMEKYGYRKGQGLGSEGNKGIINPLEMLKAQKGAPRGTIVNRDQDEAAIARERYGEPSDVIVLSSGLDLELHLSSELSQEIEQLCTEHGFVRRIILHTTSKKFRAFIQFSGMAGAYRAVRALEGYVIPADLVCLCTGTAWKQTIILRVISNSAISTNNLN